MKWKKFPYYIQPDEKDCGPTCIRIIAKHYGKNIPLQTLRDLSETTREGTSLWGLNEASEKMGFRTLGVKIDFIMLKEEAPLPCIVHWNKNHFVVVYKIKKNRIYISDPAYGLLDYSKEEFLRYWIGSNTNETTKEGIALLFELSSEFYQEKVNQINPSSKGIGFIYKYLIPYKKLIFQLFLGLVVSSALQLIAPFLTQSIVDIGIDGQDLNFIHLVLGAQLMLFLGQIVIELIRGWILLHVSTRVNIALISDFFIKLMRLPIAFFDTRMTGDILQRINDHQKVEVLLTRNTLSTLFSFVNLFVFGFVLIFYNLNIFWIFFIGSFLHVAWVLLFLRERKELNYKSFFQMSEEQSKVIELINGMQEIKLQNAERQKRWNWESTQIKMFKLNIKSLALEQFQGLGSSFINELKNIFITFSSVFLVMKGQLSLGMMLSIQYIIGQLNAPVLQLVEFIRSFQDAKISLERLREIHNKEDEELQDRQIDVKPFLEEDIILKNLDFRYVGSPEDTLIDINLVVPSKKITAIVGASGSGKTTLMKLLMKFYEPNRGNIHLGAFPLKNLSQKSWRLHCGVVMQEGYIFNDTIAGNIAVGEDVIDKEKLKKSVYMASIKDFIEDLPLSYNTKIGNEGLGLSGGQKQRILIARAIYKNPDYIFFDEATSSLDALNEKKIMDNLSDFFKGKTVVVIAHRLSTVKNADQIIVLDKGKIIEIGTHQFLIEKKGSYYRLVKEQLNLERISSL